MLLRTFGGLSIQTDGPPPSGAATQRRRLAFLAVVAASGERGISRDKLLALLWPDSDAERGRGALAQALYALRRDLGGESLFLGSSELRLNPEILPSDVGQFRDALAAGRPETAAELYTGTFLDGFHLPEAAEFERWVEAERAHLRHRFADAAGQLAITAEQRGDFRSAAMWWRRLAAHDPLDAAVAGGLIRTLAAAGDRAGALRHARVYEAMLREELELDLDPAIVALVERIRSAPPEPEPAAPTRSAVAPATAPSATQPAAPPVDLASVTTAEWRARRPSRPHWLDSASALIGIIAFSLAVLLVLLLLPPRGGDSDDSAPMIAVGQFRSFPAGGDPAGEVTVGPLSDMLATSLARFPGVRVVSNARIEELVAESGAVGGAAYAAAAREAGASELIEGAIFNLGGGLLRLDLREVDLASGTVRRATSIEGRDLVALVEQGAAEIAAGFDTTEAGEEAGPSGSGTR